MSGSVWDLDPVLQGCRLSSALGAGVSSPPDYSQKHSQLPFFPPLFWIIRIRQRIEEPRPTASFVRVPAMLSRYLFPRILSIFRITEPRLLQLDFPWCYISLSKKYQVTPENREKVEKKQSYLLEKERGGDL